MDCREKREMTPLMLASFIGKEEITMVLLESGAEIEARDREGWTPLIYAAYGGRLDAVQLILNRDARKNTKCKKGFTAADWAEFIVRKESVMERRVRYGTVIDFLEKYQDRSDSLC